MKRFWRIELIEGVRQIAAGSWWSDDWLPHTSNGQRVGYNAANARPHPYNGGTYLKRRNRGRGKP